MTNSIENHIDLLLNGLRIDDAFAATIDYSIRDQNIVLDAMGKKPTISNDFRARIADNVTFIVAVILVRDAGREILMTQETQPACYGKWYIPTGHMKCNETICTAGVREVLEETGLVVECTSLVAIESAYGSWFRFILTGRVLGGSLKTVSDSHSLKADWIADLDSIALRSNDCLALIEHTKKYCYAQKDDNWHDEILPCLKPHHDLIVRLVIVVRKKATNRMHVLVSEKTGSHLPVFQIYPDRSLYSTFQKFIMNTFGSNFKPHKPHGILTLEHDAGSHGFCLSLLVSFIVAMEDVPIIGKCVWQQLSKPLEDRILRRLAKTNSNISLHVIR